MAVLLVGERSKLDQLRWVTTNCCMSSVCGDVDALRYGQRAGQTSLFQL